MIRKMDERRRGRQNIWRESEGEEKQKRTQADREGGEVRT